MFRNNKIVVLSSLIFISAVIILYILFFSVKYPQLKDQIASEVRKQYQIEAEKIAQASQTPCPIIEQNDSTFNESDQIEDNSQDEQLLDDEVNDLVLDGTDIDESQIESDILQDSYTKLPGTYIYTGSLDIITELGLTVNYILTDNNQIYYAKLVNLNENLETLVQSQGGSLNYITDKNQLTKNLLFGDSLTYVNLPKYTNNKVNMIVRYDLVGDIWLVQVDYSKYYNLKSYLQKIFSY